MEVAIGELTKLAVFGLVSYMQTAGATKEQIEVAFKSALEGMLARDPSNIPDVK